MRRLSEKTKRSMAEREEAESVQPPAREIPAAAQRALAEAEARRRDAAKADADRLTPKEINGPKGPEPTRYGDWEKAGIASDF
jgi:hypothetical protein